MTIKRMPRVGLVFNAPLLLACADCDTHRTSNRYHYIAPADVTTLDLGPPTDTAANHHHGRTEGSEQVYPAGL
jgi:hypothetical protein